MEARVSIQDGNANQRCQDKKKQAHRALNCDVLKAYPRYCSAEAAELYVAPGRSIVTKAVALTVGIPIYYVNGSFRFNGMKLPISRFFSFASK